MELKSNNTILPPLVPVLTFPFSVPHPYFCLTTIYRFGSIKVLPILDLSDPTYFSQYSIEANISNTKKQHKYTSQLPYSQTVSSIKIFLTNTLSPKKFSNYDIF